MVQPFDYTLKTPSTTESFLAGVQAIQNQQRATAAQAAAQAEQEALNREAQFTIDAQKVRQNPTSENISSLYERHPKFGTQIKGFADRLTEADRNTYGTILEEALRAKFNGASPEDVKKIYDAGAIAS
jgi:type II secretory pathway pseudopilin PulG